MDSIFSPLEVVSRCREPQLQVSEKYSYLFNLTPNIYKSFLCLNIYFIPTEGDLALEGLRDADTLYTV